MPERVEAKVCYAIFGDYGGNAPDTADLAIRSTREVAENLRERCQAALAKEREGEYDEAVELANREDIAWPEVSGWQHKLSFRVREVLVRA